MARHRSGSSHLTRSRLRVGHACLTAHQEQRRYHQHGGEQDDAARETGHRQRPHSMPVGSLPSSTGGVTTGVASAYCVVLQSPAAALQVAAKVHGGVLVFLIVVLPPLTVITAVSPGLDSWIHSKVTVQTDDAPS